MYLYWTPSYGCQINMIAVNENYITVVLSSGKIQVSFVENISGEDPKEAGSKNMVVKLNISSFNCFQFTWIHVHLHEYSRGHTLCILQRDVLRNFDSVETTFMRKECLHVFSLFLPRQPFALMTIRSNFHFFYKIYAQSWYLHDNKFENCVSCPWR